MKRKAFKIMHRWLAFILGFFIVFQLTSGSIAQESRLLMQWLSPEIYSVASDQDPASPSEIMNRMKDLEPEFNIAHVMVPPPDRKGTAYILMGGRNPENLHESSLFVNYDQYEQEILDEHPLRESGWIGTMTMLHRWILFGTAGLYVVIVLGLATVLMSISGIYLYIRTRKSAKKLPLINRLHRSFGFIAAFFLIATSISGIAMSYVHWQDREDNLSVFANLMKTDHKDQDHMHEYYVDPDVALGTAKNAIPDRFHLSAYSYAGDHSPNYWFAFFDKQMFRQDVIIEGQTGKLLGVYAAGKTEKGDGLRNYLLPIHSGNYFGAIGGFLMSFFGFIVILWLLSGFVIYFNNRRRSSS
ncbi:MAG: PepSY-associated TM helix domain-containing protein [Gammaproteobacteria bacterium]|jgi:uncharacterized iron-regulated membrane protein|nr:hypothetical protein [Gammaproteobacteria bacterium]MDP6146741.1 PepSY-associated TM helix domain-containing protein [Gammaproteobacteria bacterium]HJL80730.1 PepSY-associated TM helix domain-containing protein [Gammaproteobacteria bacterium]HJN00014.1 PepSY-associated TM helix domain-containing protein [Gammaproteobacteria bacterium]|tara:strand:- start:17190 stop:18257 length:1068 start_codon:yes stop_codon:yes gene_type:complete